MSVFWASFWPSHKASDQLTRQQQHLYSQPAIDLHAASDLLTVQEKLLYSEQPLLTVSKKGCALVSNWASQKCSVSRASNWLTRKASVPSSHYWPSQKASVSAACREPAYSWSWRPRISLTRLRDPSLNRFSSFQPLALYMQGWILYFGKYLPSTPLGGDISLCHLEKKIWTGEQEKEKKIGKKKDERRKISRKFKFKKGVKIKATKAYE